MKTTNLIALLVVAFAPSAWAGAVTVNTDRTTFNASLSSGYTVDDFGPVYHFPISTGVLNSATDIPGLIVPGTVHAGVTYSTPIGTGNFFNIDQGGGFDGGFLDSGGNGFSLTATFDSEVSAFGFDTNYVSPHLQVVVHFNDATTQMFSSTNNGSAMSFFGFSSTASDITSVVIGPTIGSADYQSFAVDNFIYSPPTVAAVPEPETYALVLAGVGALGFSARRRRPA